VAVIDDRADRRQVLRDAALTAERDCGDPIDAAVIAALGGMCERVEVLEFEPFDADRKRAEAHVREADGSEHRVAKGAVQAILDLTGDFAGGAERVTEVTAEFARKGYRALAGARAEDGAWRVSGVLAIQDPPRDDSRETLERAKQLGVEVKMVTGDRVEIARQIGDEVGIGTRMLESSALERLQEDQLADAVGAADGFAQVVPEDKYGSSRRSRHTATSSG
jgi:H+-transporting ATPase